MTDSRDETLLKTERKLRGSGTLHGKGLLVVLSKNFLSHSYILTKNETILGRGSDCDWSLPDPLISKHHCRILRKEDGCFYLEDLNSKNSTFLNKKPIKKPTALFYSDRIVAGNTIIRFFQEEELDLKK